MTASRKGFRFANQSDYQTVMIFIIAIVEQLHAGFATKRGYYLVYFLQITSLAKVGDTFDDLTQFIFYFSIFVTFYYNTSFIVF